MAKYKLVLKQEYFLDNYLLHLIGLGSKRDRLLTHKEMYRSHKDGTSNSYSSVKEK